LTRFVLAINNCFAVKRWPNPEDWSNIVANELGLKIVQFSYDLLDPRTTEPALSAMISRIKRIINKYGITIHSTFTGLAAYSYNLLAHPDPLMRADAFDWYVRAIEIASKLRAEATGGHIGALSWVDYLNDRRREFLINAVTNSLIRLSSIAKDKGLKMLLWEPMPVVREPPHTIDQAKKLLNIVNSESDLPIRLCIDLGHACAWRVDRKEDLDPYAWLRELGAFSPVVHVQQTDGRADRHWPFTEEYNKRGIIKPDKVLDAIEDSGAKEVLLVLEIIHPFEEREEKVLRDIKESVEYWKKYIS